MTKKKLKIDEELNDEIDLLFKSSDKNLDSRINRIFDVDDEDTEEEKMINLNDLVAELSDIVDSGERKIGFNELKDIVEKHEIEEVDNED